MAKQKNDTATEATQPAGDGQLVHLCEASRQELFMLPVPNTTTGTCDRCDATGTTLFQYPRADVRLDHLAAWDRDTFNAKLDALALAAKEAAAAQEAADAAAVKKAEDLQAALVAENDAKYAAAVAARHAIEAAEAGPQTPPNIIQSPATPATPNP